MRGFLHIFLFPCQSWRSLLQGQVRIIDSDFQSHLLSLPMTETDAILLQRLLPFLLRPPPVVVPFYTDNSVHFVGWILSPHLLSSDESSIWRSIKRLANVWSVLRIVTQAEKLETRHFHPIEKLLWIVTLVYWRWCQTTIHLLMKYCCHLWAGAQ